MGAGGDARSDGGEGREEEEEEESALRRKNWVAFS